MSRYWPEALLLGAVLTLGAGLAAEAYEIEYSSTLLEDGSVSLGVKRFLGDEEQITLLLPDELDGKKVTAIQDRAFYIGMDSLQSIIIPEGVVSIGESCFRDCAGLEAVSLPDSLENIGDGAFAGCTALCDLALPDGVKSVGSEAFMQCPELPLLELPASVEKLGEAFAAGDRRMVLRLDPENEKYETHAGMLLEKETGTLLWYPSGSHRSQLRIPKDVKRIGAQVFRDAQNLQKIILPKSVRRIGRDAFLGCSSLRAFEADPDNGSYMTRGGVLFSKDQQTLLSYPAGHSRRMYMVPKETLMIENDAAAGTVNLKSLRFAGDSVYIGEGAFRDCPNLEEVVFPEKMESAGERAFAGCVSLVSAQLPGSLISLPRGMFCGCSSLGEARMSWGLEDVGDEAFADCTSLKSALFPRSLRRIGSYALSGCESLEEVYLPEPLQEIGDGAFDEGCTARFMAVEGSAAARFVQAADLQLLKLPVSAAPEQIYTDRAVIRLVQERLNEESYACGTPDGVIGRKTDSAIRSYAKEKELTLSEKDGKVRVDTVLLDSLGIRRLWRGSAAEEEAETQAEAETEKEEVTESSQ